MELTYLEAISDGLRVALREDERVIVLGEDIGAFGGAFKVTAGLQDEFGADRVIDTPISEEAIIGGAVGAAIVGMRPVCEMQFADFVACGFDQLVNVAGKLHYRLGLAAPIVVRLPSGGGFGGGPFHSQNPEAWFMHAPGLKVLAPVDARRTPRGCCSPRSPIPTPSSSSSTSTSTAASAARCRTGAYTTPMRARTAREGDDLVVIAYGAMVARRARGGRADRGGAGARARPALARAPRRGGDPRARCATARRS